MAAFPTYVDLRMAGYSYQASNIVALASTF